MVHFGNHLKMVVRREERETLRAFYQGLLGCGLASSAPNLDLFQFSNGFMLAVHYDDQCLSQDQSIKATWLELKTNAPGSLKKKLLDRGVVEVEYFDKEHFYFQSPGGQVYRMVGHGK